MKRAIFSSREPLPLRPLFILAAIAIASLALYLADRFIHREVERRLAERIQCAAFVNGELLDYSVHYPNGRTRCVYRMDPAAMRRYFTRPLHSSKG